MHVLLWLGTAAALAGGAPPDTVIVLGSRSVDMTGDGAPELLRLVGVGGSVDSLDVTLTITSAGRTLYSDRLRPLTRRVGWPTPVRTLSREEHRARLDEFGGWFFDARKFMSPDGFVAKLEETGPLHIARIPDVIARQRPAGADSTSGADVWEEIRSRRMVVFEYSPGGDRVTAIAWSPSDRRFYRLWECC